GYLFGTSEDDGEQDRLTAASSDAWAQEDLRADGAAAPGDLQVEQAHLRPGDRRHSRCHAGLRLHHGGGRTRRHRRQDGQGQAGGGDPRHSRQGCRDRERGLRPRRTQVPRSHRSAGRQRARRRPGIL
ncbi:MAG: LSU ribosomal protein L18p (L5e), partial [uncultured Propionibacteriaceae bacterium]